VLVALIVACVRCDAHIRWSLLHMCRSLLPFLARKQRLARQPFGQLFNTRTRTAGTRAQPVSYVSFFFGLVFPTSCSLPRGPTPLSHVIYLRKGLATMVAGRSRGKVRCLVFRVQGHVVSNTSHTLCTSFQTLRSSGIWTETQTWYTCSARWSLPPTTKTCCL